MVSLPRAHRQPVAGVADRHGKKQAENGFAIVAGTKALAAVAIESEEWKGYTHNQPPALAAVTTCCKKCSLLRSGVLHTCRYAHKKEGFDVIQ